MKKVISILVLAFLSLEILAQSARENFVKVSYLEKIAKYTQWQNLPNTNNFKIAVLGNCDFSGALDRLVEKHTIKGRKVEVEYIAKVEMAADAAILYICQSMQKELPNILNFTRGKPILTFSDSPGFAQRGVHFNFFPGEEGCIYFEVNLAELKKSHFIVDLYVLDLGEVVRK